MFTPPPSPAPARIARYSSSDPDSSKQDEPLPQYAQYAQYTQYTDTLSCTQPGSSSVNLAASHIDPTYRSYQMKKQTGRRTKWFIILAPALLILITLSTRYISQPILRAVQPHHIRPVDPIWPPTPVHAPILKRAPQASGTATPSASPSALSLASPTNSASSLASSLSSSPSPSGTQLLPTIPSSPPVLPTPFPQPWDTTLSNNFSTANCQNFFNNITQATSFRECRPFSLLQKVSSAFIQAQTNFTAMNDIIWGTCNTTPSLDSCTATMNTWISTLQSACPIDLQNQNAMALTLLYGLQSYSLLRTAACLPDPSTNIYCYMESLKNTDLYFYKLPLGIGLPSSVSPSCSACTKSVMGLFREEVGNLTALGSTYEGAAKVAVGQCGQGYVETVGTSGGWEVVGSRGRLWAVLVGVVVSVGLLW